MQKISCLVETDISIFQNTMHFYILSVNKNKLK